MLLRTVVITILAGLVCTAPAISATESLDSPVFLINQRLGDMRMGEPSAHVTYDYGSFCYGNCPGKVDGGGFAGLTLITYRVSGGQLRVGFRKGHVAYLETNSKHYRSASGLGVGSRIPFGRTWRGFTFVDCGDGSSVWVHRSRTVQTKLFTERGVVTVITIGLRKLPQLASC